MAETNALSPSECALAEFALAGFAVAESARAKLPLAKFRLFRTLDLDEARDEVARVFCPHRLTLLGRRESFATQHSLDLGGLSVNFMKYGADVRIDPGRLDTFFLLQIPINGTATIRSGRDTTIASPALASLLSPSLGVTMDWSWDCEKILVQIDRGRMERTLEAMLGYAIAKPLVFDVAFPRDGSREGIVRLIRLILDDVDNGTGALSRGATGNRIGEALIMALLNGHPHSYSTALESAQPGIVPRHVRRAESFMRANLDRSLTLVDVAQAAGVSVRALQDGFRRFRETTPLESLRGLRMEAARADLVAGSQGDTVTTIALRWGFTHLSRFSAGYRERYGASPSETLRRGG